MRRNRFKHSLLTATAVMAMSGAVPVIAAQQQPVRAQEAQQNSQERRDAAQTKLADAKLKACQKREKAINNIMVRRAERAVKQIDVFKKIAERTEKFYTEKGKTLSNYSALVADVNAKKAAAQAAVDAVKANSITFKCDGTDPKGAAQLFKDSLKAEIAALKDYKTAVKNLIVGVKSVNGKATSTENKTEGGQQ